MKPRLSSSSFHAATRPPQRVQGEQAPTVALSRHLIRLENVTGHVRTRWRPSALHLWTEQTNSLIYLDGDDHDGFWLKPVCKKRLFMCCLPALQPVLCVEKKGKKDLHKPDGVCFQILLAKKPFSSQTHKVQSLLRILRSPALLLR